MTGHPGAPPASTVVEAGRAAPLRARAVARSGRATTWGPPLVLLALCLGFAVASGDFLRATNISAILDQSAVGIVVAVGMTFVIVQGSIDLSVEGVMGVSGIAVALLVSNNLNDHHLGWLAVVVALAIGVAFGLANGLLYTRLRLPSLMVTLGMWSVGLGVAALLFPGSQAKITDEAFLRVALGEWLGISRAFWVAVACVAVGLVLQRYTRFGRYSYAIGGGEQLARLSGINVDRFKVLAFTFAGFMFGLAGVLAAARSGYGTAGLGGGSLFNGVAAVVIGGTLLSGGHGGVLHSTVGVLILAVLANGMVLIGVDPYMQGAVQGVLTVLAVVVSTWPLRQRMRVVK